MFDLGFLTIRFWDIIDILIVGYLMFQIYKLLRGSLAFNIFVGVILLYVVWWLVGILQMDLLSALLDQVVGVGVIVIFIIFQPEIRRFLLMIGNTTLQQRSNFWQRLLNRNRVERAEEKEAAVKAIKSAMVRLSKSKTGVLIVLARNVNMEGISSSGTLMNAEISQSLLESIFNKESPLHDGAVIISDGKVLAAGCVLPVSDNPHLPKSVGLRHRAAVGITERTTATSFIVSEETGNISFATEGRLTRNLTAEKLSDLLNVFY